jgi:phosphatidylglycerophosphate synthase
MDISLTHSGLPWGLTYFWWCLIALTQIDFLFSLSDKTLKRIGDFITPTQISVVRWPITWMGFCIYAYGGLADPEFMRVILHVDLADFTTLQAVIDFMNQHHAFIGFQVVAFGYGLDKVDGLVARARGEISALGMIVDPLIDKLCLPPMLVIFCWRGWLTPYEVWPMLAVEVFGTLIRPPFGFFQSRIRGSAATGVGKVKFVLQFTPIAMSVPMDQHWALYSPFYANIVVGVALAFAVLSVVSRWKLGESDRAKKAEKLIDRFTALFNRGKKSVSSLGNPLPNAA